MSARPEKLTPEQLHAQAQEQELLGMKEDGRLLLWRTGRVIPVSQFQYYRSTDVRRRVDSGHFVIDWFGGDVVAHLANLIDGRVSVHLMCNGGPTLRSRADRSGRCCATK
jgi:hypothetical protein